MFTKSGQRVYLTGLRGQGNARVWAEPAANGELRIRVQSAHMKLMQRVGLAETARAALCQANNGKDIICWNDLLAKIASR